MNGDAEFSFKILHWTDVEESSLKSGQSHLAPNYVLTHSGQKRISTNFGIKHIEKHTNVLFETFYNIDRIITGRSMTL
jgi:hypothetical protein